eukprot:14712182-Ditylum_brightwellii.AAC.1
MPLSKHIDIKYHWFCSWINETTAKIVTVDTDLQKADILTKPLGKNNFPAKRKMLMGSVRWKLQAAACAPSGTYRPR